MYSAVVYSAVVQSGVVYSAFVLIVSLCTVTLCTVYQHCISGHRFHSTVDFTAKVYFHSKHKVPAKKYVLLEGKGGGGDTSSMSN